MPLPAIAPKDRLIVALDLPGVDQAEAMIARLGDSVTFYKIGYQLAYAGGLSLVSQLTASGKKVFVDLKLHDIGNTVARGVESLSSLGATFLTVLTSYNEADLQDAGYRHTIADLVATRARQAKALGVDGLVCSPEEASSLRTIVGDGMSLVTPGIRPAGSSSGDQKRIMTPARAIAAGADYLVVGRPVVEAADPKAAADSIHAEIAQALGLKK